MYKRITIILLLAVIAVVAFPLAALADAIAEPNNSFYNRNRTDCVTLNRHFVANGSNGYVSGRNSPGARGETRRVNNGTDIYINATYNLAGVIWGVADFTAPLGWYLMDELLFVYDYIAFEEDNLTEFYTYSGEFDALYEVQNIALWRWPGTDVTPRMLEVSETSALYPDNIKHSLEITRTYRDEQGREWMFMPLKYAIGWICISDLENEKIPAFNVQAPKPWIPGERHLVQQGGASFPWLVVILVALLVVITIVLIWVFWYRKNKYIPKQ